MIVTSRNLSVGAGSEIIVCSYLNGPITITLPDPARAAGSIYTVANRATGDGVIHPVTLHPAVVEGGDIDPDIVIPAVDGAVVTVMAVAVGEHASYLVLSNGMPFPPSS